MQVDLSRSYARVLNPLVAAQMDRATKIDAIKKLHAFGFDFDIFCPVGGIIDDMIEEFDVVFSQVTLLLIQVVLSSEFVLLL
jgi:6,7-dimethyl-8-ribityllumazine synthase